VRAAIIRNAKSILVTAHLDTGASRTAISEVLAQYLGLVPASFTKVHTAAGLAEYHDYMVDILFPGRDLKNFIDLRVGSCTLPYKHDLDDDLRMLSTNFGMLIGRDMMSRWNIFWNGPTSSVFISD